MDNDEKEKNASNQAENEDMRDRAKTVESIDSKESLDLAGMKSMNLKEPKPKKSKKNFLINYALTLLVVAFGLVLLSYFNEIRMNKEEIVRLKEEKEQYSISAMKDIQNLQDENTQLNLQVEELVAKITEQSKINEELVQENTELKKKYAIIADVSEKATQEMTKQASQLAAVEAMMYIDQQYRSGNYSRSAYEISKLENGNDMYIVELFANQENGAMITKLIDRYTSIREWLDKYEYMDPTRISNWVAKNKIK